MESVQGLLSCSYLLWPQKTTPCRDWGQGGWCAETLHTLGQKGKIPLCLFQQTVCELPEVSCLFLW